jgi:hypothetical protein
MERINEDVKIKIIEKLHGMVLIRSLENTNPKITVPEFKFIIGVYRIRKEDWYVFAKELESEKVIKLFRNFKGMKVLRSSV